MFCSKYSIKKNNSKEFVLNFVLKICFVIAVIFCLPMINESKINMLLKLFYLFLNIYKSITICSEIKITTKITISFILNVFI